MHDIICEALKIFLERHLVPTVISVVVAIVALLVLPADYWMIEKIGKIMFFFWLLVWFFLLFNSLLFYGKVFST